jgi:dihydroorotate dehydrogenase
MDCMSLYTSVLRPALFKIDPEVAHHLTVESCRLAGAVPPLRAVARRLLACDDSALRTEVAGLSFANPIGLAAGWDKSGRALAMLGSLGFGFAEIGSISADASEGNPKPRLFRLPQDRAIVVNYGLPNEGAEVVASRLQARRPSDVPIGVNIVKTNRGPNVPAESDEAILDDYVRAVRLVHKSADYLMLNLSCPNAQGGRDFFADTRNIGRLLEGLQPLAIRCPVFLKIAPSEDPAFLDALVEVVADDPLVKGFMFNLPAGKPASLELTTPREVWERWPGAVAGRPVANLINSCVSALYRRLPKNRFAIIAAGGVFTAEDAYEKIRLGASLVQIYTALVYEGPGVTKRICGGLRRLLARDGFRHVGEAVGTAVE